MEVESEERVAIVVKGEGEEGVAIVIEDEGERGEVEDENELEPDKVPQKRDKFIVEESKTISCQATLEDNIPT